MSSISNFERNKPTQTYKSIKELYKYISKSESLDKEEIKSRIKEIEKLFLEGA